MSDIIKVRDQKTTVPDHGKVNVDVDERKFTTRRGPAELSIQDKSVTITHVNYGIITCSYGTIVKGPTHLAEMPSNIRINGFWVLNDELMTTVPSTTYTPIPVFIYKESPYPKMIRGFMDVLKV